MTRMYTSYMGMWIFLINGKLFIAYTRKKSRNCFLFVNVYICGSCMLYLHIIVYRLSCMACYGMLIKWYRKASTKSFKTKTDRICFVFASYSINVNLYLVRVVMVVYAINIASSLCFCLSIVSKSVCRNVICKNRELILTLACRKRFVRLLSSSDLSKKQNVYIFF